MSIHIFADGFELTPALRQACDDETRQNLAPISTSNMNARWALSIEREEHIVHLTWKTGEFSGDVTVKTKDMYTSILQASKKALEQIKKTYAKRQDHHKSSAVKIPVLDEVD
jgi:ribosome-associated translation inhibitor RaiA